MDGWIETYRHPSIHPYRLGTQITLIPICLWWAILPFMGQVGQVLQKLTEILVQNTSWMISPSLSLSLAIHVILGGSIKCQHDMIWNDRIYMYIYILYIHSILHLYCQLWCIWMYTLFHIILSYCALSSQEGARPAGRRMKARRVGWEAI